MRPTVEVRFEDLAITIFDGSALPAPDPAAQWLAVSEPANALSPLRSQPTPRGEGK